MIIVGFVEIKISPPLCGSEVEKPLIHPYQPALLFSYTPFLFFSLSGIPCLRFFMFHLSRQSQSVRDAVCTPPLGVICVLLCIAVKTGKFQLCKPVICVNGLLGVRVHISLRADLSCDRIRQRNQTSIQPLTDFEPR